MPAFSTSRVTETVVRCRGCKQLLLGTSYKEHAFFCEPLKRCLGVRLNHNQHTTGNDSTVKCDEPAPLACVDLPDSDALKFD